MNERRYVLGIAYQAGPLERIQAGADGGRDWFSPDELELAAWRFLLSEPKVGVCHMDGTTGAAQVVESYIYRGPDWHTGIFDGTASEVVVHAGDWLVGAILTPLSWEFYKAGKLNGWSIQGEAGRLVGDMTNG